MLPAIVRLLDDRTLQQYNGTTPSYADNFYSYTDGASSLQNPNAGLFTSADDDINGRGSIALINYNITPSATSTTETFTFHISEPLLLSPFIYSNPKSNCQAFYGIQNMNFVLNLGTCQRMFRGLQGIDGVAGSDTNTTNQATVPISSNVRWASPGLKALTPAGAAVTATQQGLLPIITSVTPGAGSLGSSMWNSARLLFMFLTPHPSDLMPARNIVPFLTMGEKSELVMTC